MIILQSNIILKCENYLENNLLCHVLTDKRADDLQRVYFLVYFAHVFIYLFIYLF